MAIGGRGTIQAAQTCTCFTDGLVVGGYKLDCPVALLQPCSGERALKASAEGKKSISLMDRDASVHLA